MNPLSALQIAITVAGGQTALAKAVGVKRPQNVQQWLKYGRAPAKWCLPIEIATGVPRKALRPDLFADIAATRKTSPLVKRRAY